MNNFQHFIELKKALGGGDPRTLDDLKKLVSKPAPMCQCGQEKIWLYGACELCFSCTTGESDASDDYELKGAH